MNLDFWSLEFSSFDVGFDPEKKKKYGLERIFKKYTSESSHMACEHQIWFRRKITEKHIYRRKIIRHHPIDSF